MNPDLIEAIDALLPQTQCTRCGYRDCREYAVAVANKRAGINQCPPGGLAVIERLAALLKTAPVPLNPEFGAEGPRTTALIDENRCIGCTLCIQACPVDAIVGAARRMHTVLTANCTGCELCLAPCPVDCIDMIELEQLAARGNASAKRTLDVSIENMAPDSRQRYASHRARLARRQEERERRLRKQGGASPGGARQAPDPQSARKKAATIAAAMKRARERRGMTA
jgi:electron transport complex protein RnfB